MRRAGPGPGTIDAPLACPRDGAAMEKQKSPESVVLDRCPSCRGIWFDQTELQRVAHDAEMEKLAERVRQFAQPSPFACPRCAGNCVGSFVGDVEVDTCTLCHGVWLDAGELQEAKRQLDAQRLLAGTGVGFRSFLRRL